MWLKETGAKGNSEDVQNKCDAGGGGTNVRFTGSRYALVSLHGFG
jgi:hypothetical protein